MSGAGERRGWVLYDGGCPLCSGLVERFRGALEPRGFGFAPFQEPWVKGRLDLAGEVPAEMKVLTPEGELLGGVGAVLYLVSRIPWARPLAWIGGLPGFRHLLDREYRRIAANRLSLPGTCPLPSPLDAERRRSARVSARSAGIGAALWCLLAAAELAGVSSLGAIPVVFLLAPLLLVPLAFRLLLRGADSSVNPGFFRVAVLLQPLAAGAVLLSFLLPPGTPAGLLAVPWLLLCLLLALAGLFRLFLGGFARLEEVAIDVGLLFLPVGGGWLLLSRLGA
ncbi:MAG: YndJ family transporter, partial [Planctomycetota bacterium]